MISREDYERDSLMLEQTLATVDTPLDVPEQIQILGSNMPSNSNTQLIYLIVPSHENQVDQGSGDLVQQMVIIPKIDEADVQHQQQYYIQNSSNQIIPISNQQPDVTVQGMLSRS